LAICQVANDKIIPAGWRKFVMPAPLLTTVSPLTAEVKAAFVDQNCDYGARSDRTADDVSTFPNTEVPATSTFAPLATESRAVSALIPPSTEMW